MLRPGDVIGVCVLALLCVGVVMVNSAGLGVGDGQTPVTLASIIFSRSAAYLALAMAALLIASRIPLERLVARTAGSSAAIVWIPPLLIGACLLVYVPGLGREVNGATRWLGVNIPGVGALSVQPSEIAKWGMVVVVAWYAARNASQLRRFLPGLAPALALVGAVAAVVTLEDLGTGALILSVAAILLLAAGARVVHFLALAPLGLAALSVAVLARPYRLQRLTTFLDPYADPQGAGYHMIQSMVAIANGEVFGRGLGFGLQKFGYLPEDRTDFLFAVLCEEMGVAGAGLVIYLYLAVIWAGWRILLKQAHPGARLLALGVLLTFGLQTVFNLATVTGLGPTKGIALPLLSSGGTGWILTAASLGLLVGMDRRADLAAATDDADAIEETNPATFVEPAPAEPGPRIVSGDRIAATPVIVTRPLRPAPERAGADHCEPAATTLFSSAVSTTPHRTQ